MNGFILGFRQRLYFIICRGLVHAGKQPSKQTEKSYSVRSVASKRASSEFIKKIHILGSFIP